MKIGELVQWSNEGMSFLSFDRINDVGIILGFDRDDDPIVLWQSRGLSNDCNVGEYRSRVEVIQ